MEMAFNDSCINSVRQHVNILHKNKIFNNVKGTFQVKIQGPVTSNEI